jgi:ribonuclease-3
MSAAELTKGLAAILGHRFERSELLLEALTHPSATPPRARGEKRTVGYSYERLEFLGDRVLGLVIAELLWHRFPEEAEGDLTRRLTDLVRREALAEVAAAAGLGAFAIVSNGEDAGGMRDNANLLADLCEAIIGALYLDGGLAAAASFISNHWTPLVDRSATPPKDPKTTLQEWAQAHGGRLPRYKTVATEGPAHRRLFTAEVTVEGMPSETGKGPSKRAAEIAAAEALLARLDADRQVSA